MKNAQIGELASNYDVSKMTIKRVLNHCPGVNSDLREKILLNCEGLPYSRICDVYVILPQVPIYFWGRIFELLLNELNQRDIKSKFNVYTKLGDTASVENYLSEAEQLNARIILIAAKNDGLTARLSKIAEKRAVFSIIENTAAKNVFYFGSDRVDDGCMLVERCLAENPDIRRLLVIGSDSERLGGVVRAIGNRVSYCSIELNYDTRAYELSRLISEQCKSGGFDAVLCLDGIVDRVFMAMKKCNLELPVYGFEIQAVEKRYGFLSGAVCQNLEGTVRSVVNAVEKHLEYRMFPNSKKTIVSSVYKNDFI